MTHPFTTDDYSLDDVATRISRLVYKPITNSNLLAMLSDDRTTNGLVMLEARCKWSSLWMQHWEPYATDCQRTLPKSNSHVS